MEEKETEFALTSWKARGKNSCGFFIYKIFGINYIIVMSVILEIQYLERYNTDCVKKGQIHGTDSIPLRLVTGSIEWFGLDIKWKVPNSYGDIQHLQFNEPCASLKYDQRLIIYNDKTKEEFYRVEQIQEENRKYKDPERGQRAFAICRDALWNIEKYKTIIAIEENL